MKQTRHQCHHGRRRHDNDDYLTLMKRGVAAAAVAAAAEQKDAPKPTPTPTSREVVDDVVVVGARH